MSQILSLFTKEMRSYFNSPIAYGVILVFTLFTTNWSLWLDGIIGKGAASLANYFSMYPFIFAVILPAITMRSWAEERRSGSVELLLTQPVKVGYAVLGKFLAALALVGVMVLITFVYVGMIIPFGTFESGEIIGSYIGVIGMAATGIAIGMFVSALTVNTISSFLLTFAIMVIIMISRFIVINIGAPDLVTSFVQFYSFDFRFKSFASGLLDTRDLGFFIWISSLFLYLNTKVLVFRKWR